ncbi:MAG: crotonase/enoyl-CoA hydratase family protein [Betaproteobacteria bacterium]|nr:crotonase/enoyl-CoA hydratase family protein [Betaproteobacteria bacterium]
MSEKLITYELEGQVAVIGLNRPAKRNAFNRDLHKQLHEAVMRAGEEAKCGVLFGHGEGFCSGMDLAQAAATWKNGVSPRLPFYRTYDFELMCRGPIPFVSALHGATIGAGLEAAASTHVRVADETAFFGLPEGQRGIFVGGGGSVRISRLLGVARMTDLMLTGRLLKADEAERYNLVQYVVPKGQALAKAKELAERICKNAPLSNFAITNSLPRVLDMSYDDGLFVERLISEYTRSPESMERLRAFLDKKAPRLRVPD